MIRTARKRTPEERTRSFIARRQININAIPQEFHDFLKITIDRKLTLPATLIDVKSTAKFVLKKIGFKIEGEQPHLFEAVYYLVDVALRERGGELSEYLKHRHTGIRVDKTKVAIYRNIYRFPPLKERKK